jgi:chemotaxis protein MotB
MSEGQKCNCPEEGLPEWIMSYADMITILMAFFVVMYSMAGAKDKAKEEAVMKSLHRRFGPFASIPPGTLVPKESRLAHEGGLGEQSGVEDEKGAQGGVSRRKADRVSVNLPGDRVAIGAIVYFDAGSDELTEADKQKLKNTALDLAGKPQRIEIRAHPTRRPLPPGSPFRDHRDLAYARCRNVMDDLIALGIEPDRIRLGVTARDVAPSGLIDPRRANADSVVEVFMLNEFTQQFAEPAKESKEPLRLKTKP